MINDTRIVFFFFYKNHSYITCTNKCLFDEKYTMQLTLINDWIIQFNNYCILTRYFYLIYTITLFKRFKSGN